MSLRRLATIKIQIFVMPARPLSHPARFKVQRSRFNVPSFNSELGTRNSEQRSIQVPMDGFRDIHVDLDSSSPCWNDSIERDLNASARIFEGEINGN